MHPVVTKDFPENLSGGVMICGINFGYSSKDESLEKAGIPQEIDAPSFFSDLSVNNTRFRNTVCKWLINWGLPLSHAPERETAFDRSFFQTNWINSQTRSVQSNDKITIKMMVKESGGILSLIESRKPLVIIFFGVQMIQALNDIDIRKRVVSVLGERPGNGEIYQASLEHYKGTRFKLITQNFPNTLVLSLPHPQTIGITDEYMAALKPAPHHLERIININHKE
ncbi:hypothetical protein AB6N01_04215 [Alcaligenes nematophilus]|uniref:hypothetical protein n=1 Tax=Alcaligenes nematophilus TaxID=2994643 RepID=UPI0034E0DD1D